MNKNNNNNSYDFLFKLMLVGDSGVGKSSIMHMFSDNNHKENHIETIGIDFKIKTILINETKIKLQIIDSAGRERYRAITSSYYKNVIGIILVYDITNRQSFENIQNWINNISLNSNKEIYKILIGNKCDLENKRKIDYEEGKQLAYKNDLDFYETSILENLNIDNTFRQLSKKILYSRLNNNDSKNDKIVSVNYDKLSLINLIKKNTNNKKNCKI